MQLHIPFPLYLARGERWFRLVCKIIDILTTKNSQFNKNAPNSFLDNHTFSLGL